MAPPRSDQYTYNGPGLASGLCDSKSVVNIGGCVCNRLFMTYRDDGGVEVASIGSDQSLQMRCLRAPFRPQAT